MAVSRSSIVTVSAKGWVVIPSLLRKKTGLKPGRKVLVTEEDGKITLTPQEDNYIDTLYGKLQGGESLTNALLADRKKEKTHEQSRLRPR